METIFPARLQEGDQVRVIAPSRSLAIVSAETRRYADQRLADLGLRLTFGAHVEEDDAFHSSSVASRVADLHAAFSDPEVKGILTVLGGFNANQLLRSIDWELIHRNPKVFCGYSDITALNDAMLARSGLVTYYGPHYSTFGQKLHVDTTVEWFRRCVFTDEPLTLEPSAEWSDDPWYRAQDDRHFLPNPGSIVICEGEAEGTIVGGNLCTLNLLHGTEFMPSLEGTLLFLEDDEVSDPVTFDRDLQSLIHQPGFAGVRGLVIGRFQKASEMTDELLAQIVRTKPEIARLPVVSGVDFGHTDPKVTIAIGGRASVHARGSDATIRITRH